MFLSLPHANVRTRNKYLDKAQWVVERFEVVLWSDCLAGFPERPESVLISVSPSWARQCIPLAEANNNSNDCPVNAPT